MSLEQKIVYAGLSRMTKDRVVIQSAFQYWQANLSADAFDVVDVTAKLVSYLGLNSSEKKVLMIGMHAASSKAEIELAEVPAYIAGGDAADVAAVEDSGESASKSVESYTPHYQVTRGYIRLLAESVRRKGAASYNEMDEILKDEALDGVSRELVGRIKKYGFSDEIMHGSINEDECRDLAHQLYLLMIDVIGPMVADVVVNDVIDKLLESDASSRFDPRTLI